MLDLYMIGTLSAAFLLFAGFLRWCAVVVDGAGRKHS